MTDCDDRVDTRLEVGNAALRQQLVLQRLCKNCQPSETFRIARRKRRRDGSAPHLPAAAANIRRLVDLEAFIQA